ncbi:hypothetical protein EJ08DRAFT_105574 [Tothia fuscella]|uniref:Uncharacterized protein n=1 Tax=Tothia fuscella TaxID=1048955 RepID=A0A9P4NX79_9PEZI|nr:hypothetical protein EJ08DRAFT_105574 [Tothia fuscella]
MPGDLMLGQRVLLSGFSISILSAIMCTAKQSSQNNQHVHFISRVRSVMDARLDSISQSVLAFPDILGQLESRNKWI